MLSFTKKPETDKEIKNITLYNILKKKGQMSRSSISKLTNVNMVSISNYVNSFIKKGLLLEKQTGRSSGGRPPIFVDLNRETTYAIGIHVTDISVRGTTVNSTVEVVNNFKKEPATGNIASHVLEAIEYLKSTVQGSFLKGIAIVFSLSCDADSMSLQKIINERYLSCSENIPLYIAKAPLAGAYAEIVQDSDFPVNKIIYSFGDLGSCILWDNFSFYTSRDEGIEHLQYLKPWNEIMSIRHMAKELINKGIGTEIVHFTQDRSGGITDNDVISAANKNDSVAIEILEFVGLNLGVRLAFLVNVFEPKKLIFGGGVERAGKYFIDPLRKSIERLSTQKALKHLDVKSSTLGEKAVALGAAALVIRELFMEG